MQGLNPEEAAFSSYDELAVEQNYELQLPIAEQEPEHEFAKPARDLFSEKIFEEDDCPFMASPHHSALFEDAADDIAQNSFNLFPTKTQPMKRFMSIETIDGETQS